MTHPPAFSPLISVILPVYNTRNYLQFTLKNIVNDQFSELRPDQWELIAVDDGSTDGSHLVIEEWAKRFPTSVRLIRQKNSGASAARNTGLQAARGEFVYFMDSDDILMQGSIPQLLKLAADTSADIVKFQYREISPEDYVRMSAQVPAASIDPTEVKTMSVREYMDFSRCLAGPPVHFCTVQSLYSRQLLTANGIAYQEDTFVGEDARFTWSAMFHASTICYTPAELYLYHQRAGSLSKLEDPAGVRAYELEHFRFINALQDIRQRVCSDKMASEEALARLDAFILEHYYPSMARVLVNGMPLRDIFRVMRQFRKHGGDVHPGRPRFKPYYDSKTLPFKTKLRRAVAAYLFGTIIMTGL